MGALPPPPWPARSAPLWARAADRLRATLVRSVVAPTPDEAAAVRAGCTTRTSARIGVDPIAGGPSARAAALPGPADARRPPDDELYWPFGLAALHDEQLAEATAYAASGAVPYELFSAPLDTGDFELYVDLGWGFGAVEAARA